MKLKLLTLLALALVATPALAHDDGTTHTHLMGAELKAQYEAHRLEVKAEMEAKRADLKAEAELRAQGRASSTDARKASSTAKRMERQEEIALRHAKNVALRFTATVERLMNIIERIESRIAKVKANGGNTAEAEASITAAKADLVAAETNITLLEGIDLGGANFQENFSLIKEGAGAIKANIRGAHTNLMKAVSSLKGMNASSTASTSASVH